MTRPARNDRVRRERAATGLALGIGMLCFAMQAAGLAQALRFDRVRIAAGEWWLLLTGNFVHLGTGHLWMNLAGLGLVVALVWNRFGALDWALLTIVSSLGVGIGLYLFDPAVGWYVGFSGTLHGLVIAGCLADLRHYPKSAGLLLAGIVAKLAWEQVGGALPGSASVAGGPVVVDAHLYGALAGLVTGAALIALGRDVRPPAESRT